MLFYDRYAELCSSINKSPTGVGLELGVSRSTINYWKNGNTPKENILSAIADYFGVPDRFLSGRVPFDWWEQINNDRAGFFYYIPVPYETLKVIWGIDKEHPENAEIKDVITFINSCIKSCYVTPDGDWTIELKETYKKMWETELLNKENTIDLTSVKNIIPFPKMKKVPLLGTIACGEPILAEENIESYIDMPEEVRGDYALRCKGDSMINARIFDGDIVFIRQQPDVENGEIAAVLIDDEATLKKVYKYPNRIELRAENPTMKPLEYEGEELNNIRILGKAVYFLSPVQ